MHLDQSLRVEAKADDDTIISAEGVEKAQAAHAGLRRLPGGERVARREARPSVFFTRGFDCPAEATLGQELHAVGTQAASDALGRERALEDLKAHRGQHHRRVVDPEPDTTVLRRAADADRERSFFSFATLCSL